MSEKEKEKASKRKKEKKKDLHSQEDLISDALIRQSTEKIQIHHDSNGDNSSSNENPGKPGK